MTLSSVTKVIGRDGSVTYKVTVSGYQKCVPPCDGNSHYEDVKEWIASDKEVLEEEESGEDDCD